MPFCGIDGMSLQLEILDLIKKGDEPKLRERMKNMVYNTDNTTQNCKTKKFMSSCLLFACKNQQISIVKYLLEECQVDPNTLFTFAVYDLTVLDTALCWACFRQEYDIIKLLVEAGADVNLTNTDFPPLHYVCYKHVPSARIMSILIKKERSKIIHFLFKNGASVNTRTKSGKTPLMLVCKSTSYRDASYNALLLANCDINAFDNEQNTALHIHLQASKPINMRLVKLFLKSGADINAVNNRNESPVDIIVKRMEIFEDSHMLYSLVNVFFESPMLFDKSRILLLELMGARRVHDSYNGDYSLAIECWREACSLTKTDREAVHDHLNNDPSLLRKMKTFFSPTMESDKNTVRSKRSAEYSPCSINERSLSPPPECHHRELQPGTHRQTLLQNEQEIKNSDQFTTADAETIIIQAILKSHKHLGLNNMLTLKLLFQLMTYYVVHNEFEHGFGVFKHTLYIVFMQNEIYTEDERLDVLSCIITVWFRLLNGLDHHDELYTTDIFDAFVGHIERMNSKLKYFESVKYLWNLYHFVVYFRRNDIISSSVRTILRKFISIDVRFHSLYCKGNFLHVIVRKLVNTQGGDDSIQYLACLLMELGLDADIRNINGNTPLHYYIMKREVCRIKHDDELLIALVNNSHIDTVNNKGVNPYRYFQEKNIAIYPLKRISLKCLAATTIRKSGMCYHGVIPRSLSAFVDIH